MRDEVDRLQIIFTFECLCNLLDTVLRAVEDQHLQAFAKISGQRFVILYTRINENDFRCTRVARTCGFKPEIMTQTRNVSITCID